MDLATFGGGVEIDQPNKEDRDNIELSRWLAGPDVDIYWDRSKSYGFGTFTTGIRSTPDLVIDGHNRTYAVEVKPPDKSGKIHDGIQQAKRYWRDIESGRASYRLNDDTQVEIEAVLIATRNSPSGHLFENKRGADPKRPGRSRGGAEVANAGHMPDIEHAGTQQAMRQAYRSVRSWYHDSEKESCETGFGYLSSLCLDGETSGLHSTPAAFYITPGNGGKSNNWQSIPWHKKDG